MRRQAPTIEVSSGFVFPTLNYCIKIGSTATKFQQASGVGCSSYGSETTFVAGTPVTAASGTGWTLQATFASGATFTVGDVYKFNVTTNPTVKPSPTFSWAAPGHATYQYLLTASSGGNQLQYPAAQASLTLTTAGALASGDYSVGVTAIDPGGNTSTSSSLAVSVPVSAP